MNVLKMLQRSTLALSLFASQSFAYNVQIFRPNDFQGPAADLLREELKLPKEAVIVEDFEKEQLTEAIRSDVKGGGANSRGFASVSQNPSAWDGKMASTEHNSASFEILIPGIRMFGVGLGDNDGGGETVSINGGLPIALANLPNHSSNSGGRAYYLLIRAGSDDADIQKVAFSDGFTIAFDHLILARSRAARAGDSRDSSSQANRVQELDAMARHIREREMNHVQRNIRERQLPPQITRWPNRNSGMQPARGIPIPDDPTSEIAPRLQSLRQRIIENPGSRENAFQLIEMLKDAKQPLAIRRAALNSLGHLHLKDPDIWNVVDATLNGSDRETFGVAEDHRIQNGGFDQVHPVNGQGDVSGAFGETMFSPGSVRLAHWSVYGGMIGLREDCPSPAGGKVLELGPRGSPGGISQTVRTKVGQKYQLSFYTCTGRAVFHFNKQLQVQVAGVNKTVDCPVDSKHEKVQVPFEALAPLTTISIIGIGNGGFGPMVDDVQVEIHNMP